MNNKEHNLKYKYLKYKNKYLDLKNQIGGIHFNKELTECIPDEYDNGKYDGYTIYDPRENQCCKKNDDKSTECKKLVHTINHTQIPSESGIPTVQYKFSKDGKYKGIVKLNLDIFKENKTVKGVILKKDISIYEYFFKYNSDNLLDIKFTYNNKIIGAGSYGLVLQYTSENNDHIAVKYGSIEQDIAVLNDIKGKICSDLVVDSIVYKDDTLSCIIMENAVGTIDNLIPAIEKNKDILIDILYAVVIAIKCLFEYGLYYTDIKMHNILYRNTENGIQIILGDIGGAAKIDDSTVRTYPPYEFINSKDNPYKGDNMLKKKSIISWGIGVLILSLLKISYKQIDNKNDVILQKINMYGRTTKENTYIKEEVDKIIILLKQKGYGNIVNIIEKTLCNSDDRDDLTEIIKKINFLRLQ